LIAATMNKHRHPHFHDDIKTKRAAFWSKPLKLSGFKDSMAMRAEQYGLFGNKCPDIHGDDIFRSGSFLNMEARIAHRTVLNFRFKMYYRLFTE
ncbi:MAG TPA: hypothetical protein VJ946_14825, partial [Bacteroidales bacterium]|nr:hypothetical protein [Bacteroidales bacterium]